MKELAHVVPIRSFIPRPETVAEYRKAVINASGLTRFKKRATRYHPMLEDGDNGYMLKVTAERKRFLGPVTVFATSLHPMLEVTILKNGMESETLTGDTVSITTNSRTGISVYSRTLDVADAASQGIVEEDIVLDQQGLLDHVNPLKDISTKKKQSRRNSWGKHRAPSQARIRRLPTLQKLDL